jgi:hypothetical protein
VISGHYDHVGMKMAMYTMELMMDQEQFIRDCSISKEKKRRSCPKRSILFFM